MTPGGEGASIAGRVPPDPFLDRGRLPDIRAVIESARSRDGDETLERFIQKRLPHAEEAEVREAAEVAEEIVDSIPVFLARAHQQAETKQLQTVAEPLLDLAERYFLQPVDLIPEMTQGMAGLLDDAYLVLRILEHLDKGPEPFLEWDLDYPIRFLRKLVGEEVAQRLDRMVQDAVGQVSEHLQELWNSMSHHA